VLFVAVYQLVSLDKEHVTYSQAVNSVLQVINHYSLVRMTEKRENYRNDLRVITKNKNAVISIIKNNYGKILNRY
jgi:hypothetical protein